MKIIDQGKLKLNTSKSVAIDRFLELQGTYSVTKGARHPSLELSCSRYGDICIKYYMSKYNEKYSGLPSQLNAQIIEENGETYVSYYTSMNNSRVILVCGALISTIILCLLFIISIQVLIAAVACIIALIIYVYSVLNDHSNPYANSDVYVNALKKYIDAVNNWEK